MPSTRPRSLNCHPYRGSISQRAETLRPLHRCFLREDAVTEDRNYAFLYQLIHLTKDRGSLTHDDRVDAVAGAVAHFQRAMMMDVDQAAKAMRD
jgi:hypothetical protein